MIRIGKKILEGLILAGVIIGFGVIFLFEALDLFLVRPIYQRLFKKKKPRRTPRRSQSINRRMEHKSVIYMSALARKLADLSHTSQPLWQQYREKETVYPQVTLVQDQQLSPPLPSQLSMLMASLSQE